VSEFDDPHARGRAGWRPTTDRCGGAAIHLSATYAFRGYGDKRAYDYSRSGNPTRDCRTHSPTWKAAGAVITASGMGALRCACSPAARRACWRRMIATVAATGCSTRCTGAATSKSILSILPRRCGQRALAKPRRCSGSKRRATRCCASPISQPRRDWHAAGALVWSTILPVAGLQQPIRLGADLWFIRPPSTSTAIAT